MVQLDDYPTQLKHCYGSSSHTTDVAILPICIPGNDEQTLINFQNYSRSQYEKYVNESGYSGAGVGGNENWMVVVFVENTTSWTSAGGAKHSLVSEVGCGHCLVSLLLGILLFYLVFCNFFLGSQYVCPFNNVILDLSLPLDIFNSCVIKCTKNL